MATVWRVLEHAKDAGDERVISACRRLIEANRLGWSHHLPEDWQLIREMDDMIVQGVADQIKAAS
jgi:transketolase C-terminal domain/subunit